MSKFQNNKRENLKEEALTYLGGKKCRRCDISNLHFAAYDFHHYKAGKEGNLSKMFTTQKWSTIQKELDKCVILCANCHRETHAYNIKYEGWDGERIGGKWSGGEGIRGERLGAARRGRGGLVRIGLVR